MCFFSQHLERNPGNSNVMNVCSLDVAHESKKSLKYRNFLRYVAQQNPPF